VRNISFMLTTDQVCAKSKDVTRRLAWRHARAGQLLQGIVKGQGLKKGEKIAKLAVIRITNVRRERLSDLTKWKEYGWEECRREGFPKMTPSEFIAFFCKGHSGCKPSSWVTRIQFEYID
jgi:hypothetical protein